MNTSLHIADYLLLVAPVMGLIAVAIGIGAALKPKVSSRMFGIEAEELDYVVTTGVRDIFIGLVILILWFHGDVRSLAYTLFGVAFVAVCDFVVTRRRGATRPSLTHLAGAVGSAGYAICLIYSGLLN